MEAENRFTEQAESDDHLRDTLESAWDEGQAVADEKQISADVWASEIERRDPTDREVMEASYDASVARREAPAQGAEPEPEGRATFADPQDRSGMRKSLAEAFDAAAAPDKAPETKPAEDTKAQTEPPTAPAAEAPDGYTAEDRAHIERRVAEATAPNEHIAALAERHGGYLSEIGFDTPAKQAGAVDQLISTERALRTGSPEQRAAIMGALARQYGVGAPAPAPAPAPHPLQAAALAPPQAQPVQQQQPAPNSLRGRLESDWQQQQAAAAAPATPEAQQTAQQQQLAGVNRQIQEFAEAKDETGYPRHALFAAVIPEMTEAARMIRQAGHQPDLPTVYKAALEYAKQNRPEIAQAAMADARAQLEAFKYHNPVANDPRLERRMVSVATPDYRIDGSVDLKSVLDRSLKLEPEIAAGQEAHAAAEKALGFKKPRPSLRQLLEAGYSAQVG